jgi:hypothetical protein
VTGPISRERIEEHLQKAINRQDQLTSELVAAYDNQVQSEVDFKVAYAKSIWYAKSNGVVDGVKITDTTAEAYATTETEKERRAMLSTEAIVNSLRQSLTTEREKMKSLQTLNVNYREAGA